MPQTAPISWDYFISVYPPGIALDGFVADGPNYTADLSHINFNHHEGVDRLSTRATCGQVLMYLRMGLIDALKDKYQELHVWVNDCDEDVCLSWWLLCNEARVRQHTNPLIERLVHLEDLLDTTSGVYPFAPDMRALEELAWIFAPYRDFRISEKALLRDAKDFEQVIADVGYRVEQYLAGRGGSKTLDTRFEIIAAHDGWSHVREVGANARLGMVDAGLEVYLATRTLPNGNLGCGVGKLQPFAPFDPLRFYSHCNRLETNPGGQWGGSNQSGGSPRSGGTTLTLDQISECMDASRTRVLV